MIEKAIIIEQVPHEGPGTIAAELEALSIRPTIYRVHEGDPVPEDVDDETALIVMGGPMGVYEEEKYPFIKEELSLIEKALKAGSPILGICLGAQLMARAAGARVYKGESKEIGWYGVALTEDGLKDPLLEGIGKEFTVFQWHGDTFDLPAGSTLLAKSAEFPNQLVRMGPRAYAVQFHLEVTVEMISQWLREPENVAELDTLKGVIDPLEILELTKEKIGPLNERGKRFFSRFLSL